MTETASLDDCHLVHPETRRAYQARVEVSGRGLSITRRLDHAPRGRAGRVEIKVPWWALEGVCADRTAQGRDGQELQSLEITTNAGTLFVVAPAALVSEIFTQLKAHQARWQRWRRPAAGALGRSIARSGAATARVRRPVTGALRPVARVGSRVVVPILLILVDLGRMLGVLAPAREALGRGLRTALRPLGALGSLAGRGAGTAGRGIYSVARAVTLALAAVVAVVLGPVCSLIVDLARRVTGNASPLGRTLTAAGNAVGHRRLAGLTAGVTSLAMIGGCTSFLLSGPSASGLARTPVVAHGASLQTTSGHAYGNTVGMSLLLGSRTRIPSHTKTTSLPAAMEGPAPPSIAHDPPLGPHQVFGFAPYWTLGQSAQFNVGGLTTIAYFSVGVNADGSLDESGPGWAGYQSSQLTALVTRAHAAGDRVVLTVNCFDQGSLDAVTSSPTAPATLSAALISAIQAKGLDGVNIDFEGEGSADQTGLTYLIARVSAALHGVNPQWQVTMDTYASSAGDPAGFYNIAALAPWVDAFFVMEYDLNYDSATSTVSPMTSSMFSDLTTVQQYTAVVPASKVILGLPYYGLDFPTTNGTLTAQAVGGPSAVAYSQIVASGDPIYWDSQTNTAWTSYEQGTQWHEIFFEDPASIYMDAGLSQQYGLVGDGIWALGMDNQDPAMLSAIDGLGSVSKPGDLGPTSTSPSQTTTTTTASTTTTTRPTTTTVPPPQATGKPPTRTPTYHSSGQYQGQPVTLTLLSALNQPTDTPLAAGALTGFTTTDPAFSCLAAESSLAVDQFASLPGEDVVVAARPTDCADVEFSFTPPAPPGTTTTTDSTSTTGGSGTSSTTSSSSSSTSSTTVSGANGREPRRRAAA